MTTAGKKQSKPRGKGYRPNDYLDPHTHVMLRKGKPGEIGIVFSCGKSPKGEFLALVMWPDKTRTHHPTDELKRVSVATVAPVEVSFHSKELLALSAGTLLEDATARASLNSYPIPTDDDILIECLAERVRELEEAIELF